MLLDLEKIVEKYELNINGVYHIGAHYGTENEIYGRLNIPNRIFFEPQPRIFQKLSENVKGYPLVNVALGNSEENIEMFVENNNESQSSSLLKPKLHEQQYPNIKFTDKIEVEMTTLDKYVGESINNPNNYNFINIDVQGYELEVFKGAKFTLNYIDFVMAEVNRAELYEGCPMVEELDAFLGVYGLERVETNWAGGTWGDGFYMRKK